MVQAVDNLQQKFVHKGTLLAAGRRNGFLAMRPSLSKQCFVKSHEQAWCKDLPEGSHRMQKTWLENRYAWLDEKDQPTQIPSDNLEILVENQADQTYWTEPGDMCELATWRNLLDDEQLTRDQLEEMRAAPWFEHTVQQFSYAEDFAADYKQLVKTPKELRRELGIDENTTSQLPKDTTKQRFKAHKKYREAMRPLRREVGEQLKDMQKAGLSKAGILQSIVGCSGSKSSLSKQAARDLLRSRIVKFTKEKQRQKKAAEEPEKKTDALEETVEAG